MSLAGLAICCLAAAATAQAPDDGPYAMPAARFDVDTTKNVMVPMRDGVHLATDIYRPKGVSDKLPVILIRLPYNKDTYRGATVPAQFFASQGYVVLAQDVRGRWHSEGTYAVEMPDANDGYDAVDWAAKQPWSTGKVGTFGCSYLGEVQYELLTKHHPAHLAAIPQAASGAVGPAGGYYTNFGTYSPGGALTLSSLVGWFAGAGTKVKGAHAPDSLDFAALLRSLPTAQIDRRGSFPPTDYEELLTHPPGGSLLAADGLSRRQRPIRHAGPHRQLVGRRHARADPLRLQPLPPQLDQCAGPGQSVRDHVTDDALRLGARQHPAPSLVGSTGEPRVTATGRSTSTGSIIGSRALTMASRSGPRCSTSRLAPAHGGPLTRGPFTACAACRTT